MPPAAASAPHANAAADGLPPASGTIGRSTTNPASWTKAVTRTTGARRVASPPAKSAMPYARAPGRAKNSNIVVFRSAN